MTMMSGPYSARTSTSRTIPSAGIAFISALATAIVIAPLAALAFSFTLGGRLTGELLFATMTKTLLQAPIFAAVLALCAAGIAIRQIFFLFSAPPKRKRVEARTGAFRHSHS